tara:strand:- start:49 stop:744 length:696 start_codon:yes stop_codon:yes gene_type:complete
MIIGIAGRKQSGKNTVANIINGEFLKKQELVRDYKIDNQGQLVINTTDAQGNEGWGVFDVTRRDEEFKRYAELEIWPYVKIYHFADPLKLMAMNLFDLEEKQVYGSNDDKNTSTPYGKTAREFLQYLGTDVMRKIKDTVWVDYTIKLIQQENSKISIIPDVRFPNEVNAIKKAGGIVVRLTRDPYKDKHECESSLDKSVFDWSKFDIVIENHETNIEKLQSDTTNLLRGVL